LRIKKEFRKVPPPACGSSKQTHIAPGVQIHLDGKLDSVLRTKSAQQRPKVRVPLPPHASQLRAVRGVNSYQVAAAAMVWTDDETVAI
jgi:hypothetical protein